ncbi:MAG: type VI secretion system contractile sheath protein TssC [Bacteroidales bacterium]|nr:type VI secretion system contractile sheath protein TssC [Bacteroidales bacterium]
MEDIRATQMQKAAEQQQQQEQQVQQKKDVSDLLSRFGGFSVIKGIIPTAEDMNPAKKALKESFLNDSRKEAKRKALATELRAWLDILSEDKTASTELVDSCKQKEAKYLKILTQGITDALDASKNLERSYRALDAFFKNSGSEKVEKLKIVNVDKEAITDSDSSFQGQVDDLLKHAFDRLSLKDSYSFVVIPGGVFKDRVDLLRWAKMAHKYKVMLVTDTALEDENSLDDLKEVTKGFVDSDAALQNVVMACNWIVGRESEKLSYDEQDEDAFFISPAGALAGMMYDENTPISQGRAGKKFGTLSDVKGVKLDLMKSEIASLMDDHVVPMVFSEGRVMAFNNNTLYNGDLDAMMEYPIVRVFDWIKKVLMNYVHEVALENWDPYKSPQKLKDKIQGFLNQYQGYQNFFQRYKLGEPKQDPKTKNITVDISITPFFAAKNFVIKLEADKDNMAADTALE